MKRKSLLSFLLSLGLFLTGCVPLNPVELKATPTFAAHTTSPENPSPTLIFLNDGLGRTVRLRAPAQRIVSLAPSNTEILFAIGAGSQVVGRDQFSDYPGEVKKVMDIGSTADKLNTELILSLKPDLVMAAGLTSPEQIKALEDLGLTVFMLPNPTDLNGMYENLRLAARLTGHGSDTEILISSLQSRVKVVKDKVTNVQEKPLVFYELDSTDAKAPWTPGPGTFIDTLLTMAGGRNVGAILKDPWAQISLEELVRQNPDLILLGDSTLGGATPELVKQRPGWGDIAAVRNDRIFPFDDNTISRPGPRLVAGLEALAKLMHPELFK